MIEQLLTDLTIFILAIFVGYETISKVPVILHTPLMSGTNAIHGIVLVGAMLVAGMPENVAEKLALPSASVVTVFDPRK